MKPTTDDKTDDEHAADDDDVDDETDDVPEPPVEHEDDDDNDDGDDDVVDTIKTTVSQVFLPLPCPVLSCPVRLCPSQTSHCILSVPSLINSTGNSSRLSSTFPNTEIAKHWLTPLLN